MKKRIFLSIVVAVMTAILSFSLIGCNSTKKVEENKKQEYDDSVKLDISDELSSVDAPLRLSSNGFVENADGSLSTTVTATVKPARLSDTTYLYWTFYDENNVPTEGYNWETSQSNDIIELTYSNDTAVATHSCNLVIKNAFKGTTYKLRCSSRQDDYVGLDVEIPIIYDGAPASYICDNGTINSGAKFALTEQDDGYQFDFDYSNHFNVIGVDYENQAPQIVLDSVESKYSVGVNSYDIYMLFKYSAVTSGYVYLRLADYYDLFINDNLTPSDSVQPVSSTFSISAPTSPDNLKILFEEIADDGVLSDFEGYYINPNFTLGLHYFDQMQAGTKVNHEDAYLTFNLSESQFGDFVLNFRVEPILSGLELGTNEILI